MHYIVIIILGFMISACSTLSPYKPISVSNEGSPGPLLRYSPELPELIWDNALSASINLTPDYPFAEYINSYMALYYQQVLDLYRDSPLQLHNKQRQIGLDWIARHNQPAANDFIYPTTVALGHYNFASETFPIFTVPLKMTNNIPHHYTVTRKLPASIQFPNRFYIQISNLAQLQSLALDTELAGLLLQSRTGKNGSINRNIPVSLQLKIVKAQGVQGQQLIARLRAVTFYADHRKDVPLRIDTF